MPSSAVLSPRRALLALALLATCPPVRPARGGIDLPDESVEALKAGTIRVESGTLPLLLCVPHDGERELPGVPARVNGTRVRDLHTLALSERTSRRLEQFTGERPWRIACLVTRRQVDVNRPEAEAWEHPGARPVWLGYHRAVAYAVTSLRKAFPGGALLLDIHGQGHAGDTLFRGTRYGRTVSSLVARHGRAALDGPDSLTGRLAALGLKVDPAPGSDGREEQRFVGGYTVATYGSHREDGIDAIQLEFGTQQRASRTLGDTLAEATLAFLRATPGFADGLPAGARAAQPGVGSDSPASKASSQRLRPMPPA
jgi:N-formylglutamate amidohydrolase